MRYPNWLKRRLKSNDHVKEIAAKFKDSTNCLFLGRGSSFPVALEGALKLKEISYIHAEGYPAAEMKHGPIALIDERYAGCVYRHQKFIVRKGDQQYTGSKSPRRACDCHRY